ncbi:MAG: carbohydrate-binding protein [Spirochaetales bacterium]|nr:carbohydrate-binding protein [Spirochaetales bacterium]
MRNIIKWNYVLLCICLIFLVTFTAVARRRTTSTSTPTPAGAAATNTPAPAATQPPASSGTIRIEAENYSSMAGVQTESCSEGGLNVGWIEAGDWMAYSGINFASTGSYTFAFRVASLSSGGSISIDLDGGATVLGSVSFGATGGWQTWTTVSVSVNVPVTGSHAVGIYASTGGWNINWFEITGGASGGTVNTPVPGNTATPVPAATPTTPPSTGALWADEFNGSGLPAWDFDLGGGGWGNAELETYTNSTANCNQSGGYLNITALNSGGYTSSRIKSRYNRTYGRVEARLKVPMGQGLWPAFWMLGTNINSGVAWPGCGEIDIMEHINTEGQTHGYIHWDSGGHASYGTAVGCSPGNFNTYSILWDSSAIRWYVNGAQFLEANILNNINSTEEFHRPFFIILNLAVGGNWPGSPNSSTAFPAVYQIDYVRWYAN